MTKRFIILFIIIFFISQLGCRQEKHSQQKEDLKEFEGVITYHEIEKALDGTVNVDDTVKVYYANGNYAAFHSEKTSKLYNVKDYYFNGPPPIRLFVHNLSDTLLPLKIDSAFGKLQSFTIKKLDEKIFSRQCEAIELRIMFDEKGNKTYTNTTFVFSRGYLNVKKEHFKNWNLGFFNKVINESGAYYLKFKSVHYDSTYKNILNSKSYEVLSVKEEKVDPKIFVIDSLKIK